MLPRLLPKNCVPPIPDPLLKRVKAVSLSGSILSVVRWAKTAENATDYSLQNTVRNVLFLPTTREEQYKAKLFLDAAVYRGGDLASGWIYTGLSAIGMTIGAIALVAAPVAGLWALLAVRLGRGEREMAQRHERTQVSET